MRYHKIFIILSLLCCFNPLTLNAGPNQASPPTKNAVSDKLLRKVPPARVCMVNDQVFEKDQIRIDVDKKAYYGCCEMCQERLGKDASFRQAKDPVSGKLVDKATAVIGAKADGSVLYFENETTFVQYQKMGT